MRRTQNQNFYPLCIKFKKSKLSIFKFDTVYITYSNALEQLFSKNFTQSYLHNGKRYVIDHTASLNEINDIIIPELNKAIAIANRTDDVTIIANKFGLPETVIQKVKNHLFIDEHIMLNGDNIQIGRFEPLYGNADEWKKFIDEPLNSINPDDIKRFKWLIAHEYIEAGLMKKRYEFS